MQTFYWDLKHAMLMIFLEIEFQKTLKGHCVVLLQHFTIYNIYDKLSNIYLFRN